MAIINGTPVADQLSGTAIADTINGLAGDDSIDGGAGNDTMFGGDGNDTYIVDAAGDVVTETNAQVAGGTDEVDASVSYTLGANVENLTLTGVGDINATGNALANTILGNAGNNLINGLAGADDMTGGAGNDTYVIDNVGDVVHEAGGGGTDTANILFNRVGLTPQIVDLTTTVSSATQFGLANVENVTVLGTGLYNIVGNTSDNILIGNGSANNISGGAGNDTLVGGAGTDTLIGGDGNDVYRIDSLSDVTTEGSGVGTGTDTVEAAFTINLTLPQFANIENATLTGAAAANLTGNTGDNVLTGNAGANVITAGGGADTLIGGAGNDTYNIDGNGALAFETLAGPAGGIDTVNTDFDYTLGANLENLVLFGFNPTDALHGTGNALANRITGNAGANLIDGAAGADTMLGGDGSDTYIVDNVGDVVTETNAQVAGGTDEVDASVSFTLGANVENLTLTGVGDINATGNALANTILGNAGNNLINGLAGADDMTGGAGNDTYVIDNVGDVVHEAGGGGTDTANILFNRVGLTPQIVDLTTTVSSATQFGLANVENVTVLGTGLYNIVGNTSDNILIGNGSANNISGGAGNDTLVGGAGTDTLIGGDGNDVYRIDSLSDVTTEGSGVGSGTDTVEAGFTLNLTLPQFANIENATLTGAAAANLTGNTGDNVLTGNAGANTIDGGTGNDTMDGGAGNDTYVVDVSTDVVSESGVGAAGGIDTVQSAATFILGANIEKLVLTGGIAIDGTGNALANTITGNSAINTIDGGAGADTMIGGDGSDVYVVDNVGDVVTETNGLNAGSADLVQASVSFTLGANVENLTLTGVGDINATGNALANTILGNAGNNLINGLAGADDMTGGAGNDTYVIDNVGDVVHEAGGGGTDTANILFNRVGLTPQIVDLTTTVSSATQFGLANVENVTVLGTGLYNIVGNTSDNILIGNGSANNISGGAGNDTLVGGAGTDTLIGGDGNDVYRIDSLSDVTTEGSGVGTGTDTVEAAFTINLTLPQFANIENATLTGAAAANLTGNTGDNVLTGNAGANRIDGGTGNDTMDGGAGADTYVVDVSTDVVSESGVGAAGGIDTVLASDDYTLGANIEKLVLVAGAGAINGTGNALANTITGNESANTLDGDVGKDTMIGGDGNDIYIVDNVGDVVTETNALAAGGTDEVKSFVTFTLGANVEKLTLIGSGNINGTGNVLANTITGNDGNNVLLGGGGADTFIGLGGNDTYTIDSANDVVTEANNDGIDTVNVKINNASAVPQLIDMTLAAAGAINFTNIENVTLLGTGRFNITGNDDDNILTGNAAANLINGGLGDDTLVGGGGADSLVGGDGDDVYRVIGTAGLTITETLTGGTDTIEAAGNLDLTQFANIENGTLTGAGAFSLTGTSGSNELTGNAGANLIIGNGGVDTMDGGAGNDTYVVDSTSDVVAETGVGAAGGIDTVQSSATFILGANIEKLVLTGITAINGTGNALANTITGNSAINLIDGGAGADTMLGGDGNDTYVVDNIGDVVTETNGLNAGSADLVQASVSYTLGVNVENLTLTGVGDINATGNALANTILGNAGNNLINGLAGADDMTGGAGNDTYVIDNVGDVVHEAGGGGTDTANILFNRAGLTPQIVDLTTNVSSATQFGLANVENVTVLGTGLYNIVGNTSDNILIGNGAANNISGGAGNDTLVGLGGTDTLVGGDGNDLYRIDSLSDVTTEGSGVGSGTDTVEAGFSLDLNLAQFVNIENASLSGLLGASLTGTGGDNVLTGNAGANLITAGLGNDVLDGGAGNDTLIGGGGNDTYVVDSLGDSVQEVAGGGTDLVQASISYSLGFNVENLTLIGTGDINATGNGTANIINGNSGNNRIDGLAGADTMIGGAGNDTYVIDNAGDTITEAAGAGGGVDTVEAAIAIDLSLVAFANIENATLTGTAAVNLTGNAADNLLVGNSADNTLTGANGNDTLDGGLGADNLIGGAGNDVYLIDGSDTITEGSGVGSGIDTVEAAFSIDLADFANVENATLLGAAGASLTGDAGDNVLTGNSGANLIDGGAGNDTLIGGLGVDTLVGGDGSDVYRIDATDVIIETGSGLGDADTVEADFAIDLTLAKFAGIENATLTGVAAVNLTGDDANNVLIGNISANKLDGGIGNDTIDGGTGNDTVLGGAGDDNLSGSDGNDSMSGGDGNDVINGGNGADTILGDAGDDILHGGADNDRIDGGIGNDALDGGTGNDTLIGGAGNDTYTVDSAGDVVTEAVGGGTDTVNIVFNNADPSAVVIDMTALSSAGVVGAQNAEIVTITGTGLFDVVGNDADNTITGNGSANELHGGLGNDTLTGGGGSDSLFGDEGTNRMVGGTGNDSYYTSSATDTIVEAAGGGSFDRLFVLYSNLTNVAQTINLTTLSGGNVEWAFIQGSGLFNITGSAVNNFLSGNSADNVLSGLNGNDTISGGGGNDTLLGGQGDDQLDGGAGADSMDGGAGNDTYSVDNVGDVIAVDSSGIDTVTSSITYSIAGRLDLENISLLGTAAINATGNSGDNAIDGNAGDNVLTGGDGNDTFNGTFSGSSGNDTMVGGIGDDLYFVDNAGDVVTEAVGEGTDTVGAVISYTLGANVENLQLVFTFGNINGTGNGLDNVIGGNEGNNVLDGALGNDTLNGNGGLDTMTGGGGDDVFEFNTSTLAADAVVITDFTTAGDSLHFDHAIYAALGAVGALDPNAFEANGTGVASTAADRLIFNTTNGHLFYDADGTGAGAAVLVATLQGGATLASTDIHVI